TTGSVLPGWPRYTGGPIHTNPTVADLFNDGHEEVIATSEAGWIYVWNGDGSLAPGWPQHTSPPASNVQPGLFGGVAVGDLFGDGRKELVAAAWDQHVWAWDSSGHVLPGFPIHVWDTAFDTPTLVDLEHHGQLDIVVGVDSTGPPYDPYPPGGEYWAFRPTGCVAWAYANISNCVLPGWPVTMNQTPWSSSAVIDNGSSPGIVAGTGHEFSEPAGNQVLGWNGAGGTFGHWPRATGAQNFASPAVGDLFGNGSRDVVEASADGSLYAWDLNGNPLPGWPVRPGPSSLDAYPTIGPIGGGSANGVWLMIINGGVATLQAYNNTGQIVWTAAPLEWGGFAAPTIADLGSGGLSVVTLDQANKGATGWTIRAYPIPGTTRMLPGAWPGFHGGSQLSGQVAPTATMTSLPSVELTNSVSLSWTHDAGSPPASSYTVWVKDQSAARWTRYGTTSATSMPFFGVPGHSYTFTVQAADQAATADAGYSTNTATTTISSAALWSMPYKEMYTVSGSGQLDPGSSPPVFGEDEWANWDIVRDVATAPGGAGGYTLDGFGGVHAFGGAPPVTVSWYGQGFDIARGLALRADGKSGYVLDGWGGVHPFGAAGDMPPPVAATGWWPGWDIATDLQLRPDGVSGYVLDGFGGIHPFGASGDMPPGVQVTGYWSGWDIAHRFTLDPAGTGGYVLDGFGGLHQFGVPGNFPPPPQQITGYWSGWDIARGVVYLPGSSSAGYVVDAWGGFHSFGGAPPASSPNYGPWIGARGLGAA
ncbi:MAG TPA: VCBS repeat-containing protein, partial [Candidatus Dormibacteraeota bacterium]